MIDHVDKSKMGKSVYFEIRQAVAPKSNCPVEIIPGALPPELSGVRAICRDQNEQIIPYPKPWETKTLETMNYTPSTRKITVGVEWVKKHAPETFARIAKKRMLLKLKKGV